MTDMRRSGTYMSQDLTSKFNDPAFLEKAASYYECEKTCQDDFLKDCFAQRALGHSRSGARNIALDMRRKELKYNVNSDPNIDTVTIDSNTFTNQTTSSMHHQEVMNKVYRDLTSKFFTKKEDVQKFLSYYFINLGFDEFVPETNFPFYELALRTSQEYGWSVTEASKSMGLSLRLVKSIKDYMKYAFKKMFAKDFPQYFKN